MSTRARRAGGARPGSARVRALGAMLPAWSRRPPPIVWPLAVALGLAAEWASGLDLRHALPDVATGWTLLGAGLVAWSRQPESLAGPLLAATGAAWFAGNFAEVALYWYRGPLVHVLLTYPHGRGRSRAAVATGYLAAVIPPVWASEQAAIVLSALFVAVAARDHRLAVGAARRARAVSLAATATLATVLAGGATARLAYPGGDADDQALLVLQLTLCGIAVALAAGPGERPALTDLVVELAETRAGTLLDPLARALGDPTLEIGYWVPDRGDYVDAEGQPLALPIPGAVRSVTFVERDGAPLAALVHDTAVLDDPPLVEAVAVAARMATSNARLHATVRAQVAELEASRRRILAAGTEERRRLEQRLHEGALRRIAGLEEVVRAASRRADGSALERLERAGTLLARTREDLDALGRGLHPRELTERGLAGALASLAEAGPLPVELSIPAERLPAESEAVAYFVCAEALANAAKHANASRVTVAARRSGQRLQLEIADDGAGGADVRDGGGLRGLADRVEAAGGRLRVDSPPGGGTRLSADLPA